MQHNVHGVASLTLDARNNRQLHRGDTTHSFIHITVSLNMHESMLSRSISVTRLWSTTYR